MSYRITIYCAPRASIAFQVSLLGFCMRFSRLIFTDVAILLSCFSSRSLCFTSLLYCLCSFLTHSLTALTECCPPAVINHFLPVSPVSSSSIGRFDMVSIPSWLVGVYIPFLQCPGLTTNRVAFMNENLSCALGDKSLYKPAHLCFLKQCHSTLQIESWTCA